MCNARESRREDLSRFVVMGNGEPVADCESRPQADKYVDQMKETYKKMGIVLTVREVQTFPYD